MNAVPAPLDVLGLLPSPPSPGNRGSCALAGADLLAYGAGGAVVLVDVSSAGMRAWGGDAGGGCLSGRCRGGQQ